MVIIYLCDVDKVRDQTDALFGRGARAYRMRHPV